MAQTDTAPCVVVLHRSQIEVAACPLVLHTWQTKTAGSSGSPNLVVMRGCRWVSRKQPVMDNIGSDVDTW